MRNKLLQIKKRWSKPKFDPTKLVQHRVPVAYMRTGKYFISKNPIENYDAYIASKPARLTFDQMCADTKNYLVLTGIAVQRHQQTLTNLRKTI